MHYGKEDETPVPLEEEETGNIQFGWLYNEATES